MTAHAEPPLPQIKRAELVEIVGTSAEGITESTRAKLLAVAETTEAVAVGWFHCGGVQCPASQAHRRNQAFQEAFDRAMAERFGLEWEADRRHPIEPFILEVVE